MNDKRSEHESFRTLQLMNELEQDDYLSQRELAGRLGIAVGLVNSYLKNLGAKGFLRVKSYPRNRYAYLLTPKGLAEKSRLAYQHMHYFNNLYTVVRHDYLALFRQLKDNGEEGVIFCGVDEVTEIAYFSLKEAGLEVVKIVDVISEDCSFLGEAVLPFSEKLLEDSEMIVLTSLKRAELLRCHLMEIGVEGARILSVSKGA